ncbi:MAG: DUF4876 domain-containing protein [Rhodothermaceae bacterium]
MKYIISLVVLFLFIGCNDDMSLTPDGNGSIKINVLYNNGSGNEPLDSAIVILTSEYGSFEHLADENGYLEITGLPASNYNISIRKKHPTDKNVILTTSDKNVEIAPYQPVTREYVALPVSGNGLVINEIYSAGPDNNIFFFYDQFIELYNNSDEVRYLDGMMITRISGNRSEEGIVRKGPGADEDDDGDIDGATYVFKFPGKPGEKNFPIHPQTFVVLAQDAVNHKSILSTSIDLSGADWEFYNQYSSIDIDNQNVANLINMRSDKTVDFMINLTSDVIALTSGKDTLWSDGLDIDTIIDAVEYQSKVTYRQTLDDRVDRGVALSAPRYSGKSIQRRAPGMDSNDALLDWEIIEKPTPGYHK